MPGFGQSRGRVPDSPHPSPEPEPESPPSSPERALEQSLKWSLYAGGYAFLCGLLLLVPLGFVAQVLVGLLTGQTATAARGMASVVVPGSGAVIGTAVW
jgi:hypothetical protein